MAQTTEQAREGQIQGLVAKAGKSVDVLVAEVLAWGPGTHTELLRRAKEAFGLGHGHANFLVHLAREQAAAAAGATPPDDPLDAIYAGSKAPLRPLHEAFMARVAAFGPFEVAPKKANVSLRRSKQFALVGPASKGRLEVGVNHRGAEPTARFEALAPGQMCTHRAYVSDEREIDDELLGFVRAAYDAVG